MYAHRGTVDAGPSLVTAAPGLGLLIGLLVAALHTHAVIRAIVLVEENTHLEHKGRLGHTEGESLSRDGRN